MKKVLIIVPSLSVGGLEKMAVTVANALNRAECNVTLMTLEAQDDLKYQLDNKIKYVYKPYKPFKIMRKIPYIKYKLFDDGMWETRASFEKLHDYYIGNEKYDVEIAFFRGLPIKIISGCRDKNTVKLAWVHNDFRKANGYHNNFKSDNDVFCAYKSFDNVICVSNEAADGFKETIGNTGNIKVIYNMLPVSDIKMLAGQNHKFETKKSALNAVVVARLLDSAKGQIRLIDAVCRLKNEGNDISLTIVGGGEDEQKIKAHIKEKNADEYIFMTGSLLNPYPYIKNSDLLICSSYFEGYNLTVAEAIILGVPVLSTSCTGPNEILDGGKYGMIVENSEAGLYGGLKEFAQHPQLLCDYKNKAHERSDFFDEKRITNQITELFVKR